MMEDILFCYVREHPHLGYRQGMHELLAPILFVMHAELRDTQDDPSLAPVLRDVMDPAFIEHDTYALFAELMEMVEPWYSAVGLEADQVKARQQVASSQRKNMTQDPRTSKPFEEDNAGPSSAISRKLDVVHNVLLKKADQVLYLHLKQLSIPAQTYGIRWIRLLFGREFPLPSVLEVWDAVFADGPSLVDYMCVAMLMHIREVLIEGDYATCMHHLMHFPTVYEVNYLVQRSLHLRNPAVHPSPSLWSHHPHHKLQQAPSNPPHITPPFTQVAPHTHQQSLQQPHASRAKQAGAKAKQVLSTAGRQLASGIKRKDGAESKVSPPPSGNVPSPSPPPLMASPTTAAKESKKGRGKIIGDLYESKEMKKNPKISPSPHSLGQLERLTSRVDDLEAKIAYCGSKMDSLLMAMEDEVAELTAEIQLQPETENTLLLSLAGLKHVRDILLNKICFSGAMLTDEHNAVAHRQPDVLNGAHLQGMSIPTPTLQTLQEPISITRGNRCVTPPMEEPSVMEPHPLMSSGEMEGRDEWVNLSTSQHPLVSSD
jgi:hypothetical protein